MHNATLCLLVKRKKNLITAVCLAMKKRGFGVNKWNGVGGKVGDKVRETIAEAAIRETDEEIGIKIKIMQKIAILGFIFPQKPEWSQKVHVFLVDKWLGLPVETEEMKPKWFNINNIPYNEMWPDDRFWLPLVIAGKKLTAVFQFNENQQLIQHSISQVASFA